MVSRLRRAGWKLSRATGALVAFSLIALPMGASADPTAAARKRHAGRRAANHDTRAGPQAMATKAVPPPPRGPLADGFAVATAADLARRDQRYSMKGWDIGYPSQADTILQDAGGLRSALDKYGIAVLEVNADLYSQNLLDTPLKVPNTYAPSANAGAVAAGHQVYAGERPTFANDSSIGLVYDASRNGIPDGQIAIGGQKYNSTWQPYLPNVFSLSNLSYYQTAFDKKVEIEIGLMPNNLRFVGDRVGTNFVSTFGPAAAITTLLGMSFFATPAADVQFNATDHLYTKASVQRSAPVDGATGNPIYDEAKENPTGFRFSAPGDGVFLVDEVGYRVPASPGAPQTWIRVGGMYNSSRFRDFAQIATNPTATIKGNEGIYALADRQIFQTVPGSPLTAYRGLYLGATFEYAPPRETPISQYYEGRIYMLGPFDSRPTDLVSFVYNHQTFSAFIADQLNPVADAAAAAGIAVPTANRASNSYTLSYLAHLSPGVYLSTGLGYTDNPSTLAFVGEGRALEVLGSLVTVF